MKPNRQRIWGVDRGRLVLVGECEPGLVHRLVSRARGMPWRTVLIVLFVTFLGAYTYLLASHAIAGWARIHARANATRTISTP